IAAAGAPTPPTSGSFPVQRTTDPLGCTAQAAGTLTGKVALISRGTCTFYVKSRNAQLAGASAVILYNNTAGTLNATVAASPAVTIPVVGITQADGNLMVARLAGGPVTMTWTDQLVNTPNAAAGLVSTFSS